MFYGGNGTSEVFATVSSQGNHIWSYNTSNDKKYKIDSNVLETVTQSFTSPTLWILNCHYGVNQENRVCVAKLYYAKIWNNGALVRNMIPCMRNTDNVAGMYDIVNDVFYTNAGTGEFIVGNNVVTPTPEMPIEVNSLGESGNINVVTSGKNLFNRSTAQENKSLRWLDGQLGAEIGSITSDFIDVIPNEYYITNYYAQWMCYDKDNNFLGTLDQPIGYFKGKIPSNITKIRLGYRATYNQGIDLFSANIQFERGNVTSTY